MSENAYNQSIKDGKPVNINISFNISRKQVTQNINPLQQQRTFNLKNTIPNQNGVLSQNSASNLKFKNQSYRGRKTPELPQTDRIVYSKDTDFIRPTQQLKKKKKRKRNSADQTADKTSQFPFYNAELQRSIPGHKRGLTTALTKKPQTALKSKRQSFKIDQSVLLKQNRTSSLIEQSKPVMPKSIKQIINKIIMNNQLSKRSLPIPTVGIKSKYNKSECLTSRKPSKPSKKKSSTSKSQTMTKFNKNQGMNQSVQQRRREYSSEQMFQLQQQRYHLDNAHFLQKLNNFKSMQNSLLISQMDRMQMKQETASWQKRNGRINPRIVIKTDESVPCIDEIHNFQKNKFKDQFFNHANGARDLTNQQLRKTSQTQCLIQMYIKLLNQNQPALMEQSQPFYQVEEGGHNGHSHNQTQHKRQGHRTVQYKDIPSHINQKISVCEQYDENHLENLHFERLEEMMGLKNKQSNKSIYQNYDNECDVNESPIIKIQQIQRYQQQDSLPQDESQLFSHKIQSNKASQKPKNLFQRPMKSPSPQLSQNKSKQQDQSFSSQFKPFISSQLGRQRNYGYKDINKESVANEQQARLKQLKKHQILKWSYLLEYIKSNINNNDSSTQPQVNTQEVLEQVYEYLSQAKVDLIKQGRNVANNKQNIGLTTNLVDTQMINKNQNRRFEEEFANKLSSQCQRSQYLFVGNDKRKGLGPQQQTCDITGQPAYAITGKLAYDITGQPSYESVDNGTYTKYRLKSQQQQILQEEIKSFKEEYQSQDNQQYLKFMNLQTIQSALKNHLNMLSQKKQKQLEQLQQKLEEKKLKREEYDLEKQRVEKWFKHQTNQISAVKRNIWKGYNEAKGILDKSYMSSEFQQDYRGRSGQVSHLDKSGNKDRKMMKCLSESYLIKKKVDYRKFIEQADTKRKPQDTQNRSLKGEQQQNEDDHKNEDYQQWKNNRNQYYDDEQQHQDEGDYQLKQEQQDNRTPSPDRSQQLNNISQQHSKQISQQPPVTRKVQLQRTKKQKQNNTQDQMDKISQKVTKLKEPHQQITLKYKQQQAKEKTQDYSQQLSNITSKQVKRFRLQVQTKKISITPQHQHLIDHQLVVANHPSDISDHSPVVSSSSANPLSPTSVHYQQVQKQLHSHTQSQEQPYQQQSDEQNDYVYEVNEQDSKDHDDSYESQQENILSQELAPTGDKLSKKNHLQVQSNNTKLKKIDLGYDDLNDQEVQVGTKNTFKQVKVQTQHLTQNEAQELTSATQKHSKVYTQLMKKFRYLTEQDKQDIFEFLFLDLCIELYQQPCNDNKIMSSINSYVTKQNQMSKRKKGVKTNLNVVKDYLKRFCGYIIRTNKKMLQNMNVPMGPTAIEMLKYMHENDDFQDEPIDEGEGTVTLIIPVNIFDTFERTLLPTLEFEKYYQNEEKQQDRVNFLKNILHIHNKALFDALNEFLDQQRPFGIWGKPFPWKNSTSFSHKFTQIQHQQKLKKSAQKVVQACSYVCGLLVDKQQSLIGNAKVSQGYIQQIRQDRISRMLANDMIQNQERWVFYDDQETQVLVQAGNYIYNKILKECIEQMHQLRNRFQHM